MDTFKTNSMKVMNSFGIYFNLKSEKEKDGKAPVYVSITVNREKVLLATKQWISVKCWDMNKRLGKSNTAEGKDVNVYLDKIKQSRCDEFKACKCLCRTGWESMDQDIQTKDYDCRKCSTFKPGQMPD
jgi:hypothetical protein